MAIPAELALRAFILDYLNKRGLTAAADGLRADHIQKGEQVISYLPVDSPNAFLFEWFGLFWDIFSARLSPKLSKNKWHQQHLQQQSPHQHHQQRQPHAQQQHNPQHLQQMPQMHQSQHLQQSHHQHPANAPPPQQQQHQQHPSQSPDPTVPVQPNQVPNPTQALSGIGVDGSVQPGASSSAPGAGPLGSNNIGQNPQNLFAAHPTVTQARARAQHQASQAMLNHPAFRNTPVSMQNAALLQNQQLQNHQFRQQQQQQALLQTAQRPQQSAAGQARLRNASVDNRRTLSQAQLHSLSLDPTMQGQKNLLAGDQAAVGGAISGDLLDMEGTLEGLLSSVDTRVAPPRSGGAGTSQPTAPNRGMMQQMPARVQTSQAPTGSNGLPLRANGSKNRQFAGLPNSASEAQSSASRRGSMDISVNVNRPYEDAAVEDESQPRAGPNGASTTSKKRGASQGMSRKSAAASGPDGIVSPRTALGSNSEGGAPAKRQRSSGAYQRNVSSAPVIRLDHQKQLPADLEQFSRGLQQQSGAQGHAARNRAKIAAMRQQQQQAYAQGGDRMNSAQLLSQLGSTDNNGMNRNGNRYNSRNGVPNPPPFGTNDQAQNNRQREAFLQSQLTRRNSGANDSAKGTGVRGTSRVPKGSDVNVSLPQGSQGSISLPGLPAGAIQMQVSAEGFPYGMKDSNERWTVPMPLPMHQMWVPSNTPSLGLGNNGASKKLGQNGHPDGNPAKSEALDQQSGVGSDAQQGDGQISDQHARKDESGSLRMRQSFGRGDLLKQTGTIQISEQELNLPSETKSKPEANAGASTKQNSSRGDLKRNTSSRAMKTIETTGVSRGRAGPDSANKNSTLSTPPVALPPVGFPGSMVPGSAKRDKGMTDGDLENRSTKSDRPASGNRGGGTPSQKSTASGGSAAVEGRAQGTSSSGGRRGRGRSRGRGSGNSRRGRGDRGAPPRGGNGVRGGAGSRGGAGAHAPRTTALEQKAGVSAGLQRNSEAARASQAETERMMNGSSILVPPRGNSLNHESRTQNQKGERGRSVGKHVEEAELQQRSTKTPFDIGDDNTNRENRGQDQSVDRQQSGNHLQNGGQAHLLDMFQQSSNGVGGRMNGEVTMEHVDKAFEMGLITGSGTGKMGNQTANNYVYENSQFMSLDVEGTDIGNMLMPDNLGLEAPTDFEDGTLLGVPDPSDLAISGRNRS